MGDKAFNRYMVFTWSYYEATGGLCDCAFSTEELSVAVQHAKDTYADAADVFDRLQGVVVFKKRLPEEPRWVPKCSVHEDGFAYCDGFVLASKDDEESGER